MGDEYLGTDLPRVQRVYVAHGPSMLTPLVALASSLET